MLKYKHIQAVHPGEFVRGYLDEKGVSTDEFARRLGVGREAARALVVGGCRVTADLAARIAAFTGVSSGTWLNLQREYDEDVQTIRRKMEKDRRAAAPCRDGDAGSARPRRAKPATVPA